MQTIGFIGLGHMGKPMAERLLAAGFTVKVFDLAKAAVQALAAKGAIAAESCRDIASDADVIITVLQSSEQVSAVCLGTDGLFANARPEILYIDCSSIEIATSKMLHEEAATFGVNMVDAPMSGGVNGATAGTLTFMVGGTPKNFKQAKPLLEKMGKTIVHVGEAGLGQAAKICNNLILGISMIAVCEGFSLAEKLGLDAKKFFEISSNSTSQCWSMTSYCPVPGVIEKTPANNNYQAGFAAKMMLKDLRLGQHAAESVDALTPLGSMATELYTLFVNQGNEEMDFSGIIKMFEE
jgi:3-hydroxyisobutyrate dehydrogenase